MGWPRRLLHWMGAVPASDLAVSAVTSQHPEAEHIVDARDYLNAILHERHGQKVLLVHEERAIRHLFQDCGNAVEFGFRVISLGTLVSTMNEPLLKSLSGSTETGSINLLRDFFVSEAPSADISAEIQVLRDIMSVRNMFPTHRDNASHAMTACARLGLGYPIADFRAAWTTLLSKYAGALEGLLEVAKKLPRKPGEGT